MIIGTNISIKCPTITQFKHVCTITCLCKFTQSNCYKWFSSLRQIYIEKLFKKNKKKLKFVHKPRDFKRLDGVFAILQLCCCQFKPQIIPPSQHNQVVEQECKSQTIGISYLNRTLLRMNDNCTQA